MALSRLAWQAPKDSPVTFVTDLPGKKQNSFLPLFGGKWHTFQYDAELTMPQMQDSAELICRIHSAKESGGQLPATSF
jgi:hypothetical protein